MLERFLRALFAHLPPGFIEVRLIEDKKGGKLVAREFYANPEKLLADLDRLRALAEARNAAVFFGVLPRRERGKGTTKDVVEGLVVWADLDFKDFPGGEAEARKRLAAFPVPPSIIVRSGHGLHAYWLLRGPTDPRVLSGLAKRIARAVGGDHTFDAARILRLPETLNRKDPANPLPVEIEILEPGRAYNASEIEEALELFGVAEAEPKAVAPTNRREQAQASPSTSGDIGDAVPPNVLGLMAKYPRIQNLFFGKGKAPVSRDGRNLDVSSSGYDFSLVLELRKKGITDPLELAATLHHRPDEAAKAKGRRYIEETVQAALERFQAGEQSGKQDSDPASEIDFAVESARIFSSNPARYELTIEGRPLVLTSNQLLSASAFTLRFLDAYKRIPATPTEHWAELVNAWLASAETVEAPPEASTDIALREAVEFAIANLRVKEDAADLHRGGAVRLDAGTIFFRTDGLLKTLIEDRPRLSRTELCFVLRELGWQNTTRTIGRKKVRGWVGPDSALDTRETPGGAE